MSWLLSWEPGVLCDSGAGTDLGCRKQLTVNGGVFLALFDHLLWVCWSCSCVLGLSGNLTIAMEKSGSVCQ